MVITFYSGKNDEAPISFVKEASDWVSQVPSQLPFEYPSTRHCDRLLSLPRDPYPYVIFLDTRREMPAQRAAFETHIKKRGAWRGFQFSAFSLSLSIYPQKWNWYHAHFLESGNTWHHTVAPLPFEAAQKTLKEGLFIPFKSSLKEGHKWKKEFRKNLDIEVFLSIHPSHFPLGIGPKSDEIGCSFPGETGIIKYQMMYINMEHADMNYQRKHDNQATSLSSTFEKTEQNQFIANGLKWLLKT